MSVETHPAAIFGSITSPSEQEIEEVYADTEREREWLKDSEKYESFTAIKDAITRGNLVEILPTTNYRPTMRFFNPKLFSVGYIPYLAPEAAIALDTIAAYWRYNVDELDLNLPYDEIRLSVTSFVRSNRHQRALIDAGKLAVEGSSHTAGLAFDIDASGYYAIDEHGKVISVSQRPSDYATTIAQAMQQEAGVDIVEPQLSPHDWYDERVTQALYKAARLWQGCVNVVDESPGSLSSVVHVGVNPNYEWSAA
jgi:hypothetical protein